MTKRTTRLGFGAGVAVLMVANAASAADRYVLAVGANTGTGSDVDLAFAEDDARRFVEVMGSYGGVDPETTRLLLGRDALELRRAISELAARVERDGADDATVFFYFSGHADRRALHVAGERIELRDVESWLAEIPADLRVSVIDACRSPVDVRLKGFSTTDSFAIQLRPSSGVQGLVTLRSASDGEASQESQSLRGAVFTHYLLTALRGAGDIDGDDRVTLDEAYRFAYRQTVRRSSLSSAEVMHPSVEMDIEGAGELVLTETVAAKTRIALPPEKDARYLVFKRPSGAVVAELWSQPKRRVEVAVTPGDYLIHRVKNDEGAAANVSVRPGKSLALADESFVQVPVATLAAKGGRLSLWQQELRASVAGHIDDRGALAGRPQLRYNLGRPRWELSVGLEFGRTEEFQNGVVSQRESWIGGDLRYGRRDLIDGFVLFAGASWRWIDQTLERNDIEEELPFDTSETFSGFAGGPTAGVSYSTPLGRSLTAVFELSSTAVLRREGGELRIRPELAGGLGIAWSF